MKKLNVNKTKKWAKNHKKTTGVIAVIGVSFLLSPFFMEYKDGEFVEKGSDNKVVSESNVTSHIKKEKPKKVEHKKVEHKKVKKLTIEQKVKKSVEKETTFEEVKSVKHNEYVNTYTIVLKGEEGFSTNSMEKSMKKASIQAAYGVAKIDPKNDAIVVMVEKDGDNVMNSKWLPENTKSLKHDTAIQQTDVENMATDFHSDFE